MALAGTKSAGRLTRLAMATVAAALLPCFVDVAGGSSPATAFSNPSLAVEQLDVPSPGMGRNVRVEFLSGGPDSRRPSTCSTAWRQGRTSTAGTSIPRRSTGTATPGFRLSCRSAASRASTATGTARRRQRPDVHLQMGNIPDARTSGVARGEQERRADRQRGRRILDGRFLGVDPRRISPAAVQI